MSNTIAITGNLGSDAEVKTFGDKKVCNMRVATKTGYGDKAVTVWFDVSVWGAPVEWLGGLKKGQTITAMGQLTAREHDGKTYLGINAHSVDAHERTERAAPHAPSAPPRKPAAPSKPAWGGRGNDDDDLPF